MRNRTTPRPMRLSLTLAALLAWGAPRLTAQEIPPPPPPPPPAPTPAVAVLPPIALPAPAPLAPVSGAVIEPAPSLNAFAPLLPPPAGTALANTPPLLVDFWTIGQHHLAGSDSQFAQSQFSVAYDLRYPVGPFTFGIRPQFDVMFLNGPTLDGPDLPPQVYGLAAALEAEFRVNQCFSVRATLIPGLYTDFNNLTGRAFRMPAQVVGAYGISDRLVLVGGVMYTGQPSLSILPVAGVIWTPEDVWRLELTFPRARVVRRLDGGLSVYGLLGLQGETYAVRSNDGNDLLQYRDIRFGFGAEWNTPATVRFFFEAGVAFARRIEFENQPGTNVDPGLYLRIGGRY